MRVTHFLAIALLTLTLALASGCNVLGLAANTVAGGETVPATFVMPGVSTVVIAENYSNPAESSDDEPLARFVTDELSSHKVAPMIDPSIIYQKQHDDPEGWRSKTIAAAGREVGAQQVLYVDVIQFGIEHAPDSGLIRGRADVRLRLVDAATGATIWPSEETQGYSVNALTPLLDDSVPAANDASIRAALLRGLSARISTLFYSIHKD